MRNKILFNFISLLLLFIMVEQIHAANLVKIAFKGDSVTGKQEELKVMFNPTEVNIKKTVPWKEEKKSGEKHPKLEFKSGERAKIGMKLLFETYSTGENVKDITDRLEMYSRTEDPECVISWLPGGDEIICHIEDVYVLFIEFFPDGTPAAAYVDCVFKNLSTLNKLSKPGTYGTTEIDTFIINQDLETVNVPSDTESLW